VANQMFNKNQKRECENVGFKGRLLTKKNRYLPTISNLDAILKEKNIQLGSKLITVAKTELSKILRDLSCEFLDIYILVRSIFKKI
jgi:hypothetical protein